MEGGRIGKGSMAGAKRLRKINFIYNSNVSHLNNYVLTTLRIRQSGKDKTAECTGRQRENLKDIFIGN